MIYVSAKFRIRITGQDEVQNLWLELPFRGHMGKRLTNTNSNGLGKKLGFSPRTFLYH